MVRATTVGDERLEQIIDKYHGEASALIQILLDIQAERHWLPKEVLERVSERLHVPNVQDAQWCRNKVPRHADGS